MAFGVENIKIDLLKICAPIGFISIGTGTSN